MSAPGSPRHAGDASSAGETRRAGGESSAGGPHGVGDDSSASESSRHADESGRAPRDAGAGETRRASHHAGAGESSRPPGDAADYGLPEHPACPFCERENTELHSAFGPQLSVATYWCRDCRAPFDFVKWKSG